MIVDHFFRNVESETSAVLALFGSEIGIKYFPDFILGDSIAGVANLDIGVKIFFPAVDYNFAMLVGRCLDGIDNNVLDGTRQLNRIAEDDAFFIGNMAVELDAVLRSHATNALADVLDDAGDRDRFGFSGANLAVALPHGEKFTAQPHVLLDDLKFSWRARSPQAIIGVAGFQFFGQNLDVTPDDGEWIA